MPQNAVPDQGLHVKFYVWSWNNTGQLKKGRGVAGEGKRGGPPLHTGLAEALS